MNNQKDYIITTGHRINFNLFFVERKTLEIAVHPNGEVVVKAPVDSQLDQIKEKVWKRSYWIIKQQQYFNQFIPRTPERNFILGETHLYLGRQYRLKIVPVPSNIVKLSRGKFLIFTENKQADHIKSLLDNWYYEKAVKQFKKRYGFCWDNFPQNEISKPILKIRKMGKRWGSLSKNKTINLNPDLVKAPKECIDYVITHELCHLYYKNHDKKFFSLLENIIPNWKRVKHNLELLLS